MQSSTPSPTSSGHSAPSQSHLSNSVVAPHTSSRLQRPSPGSPSSSPASPTPHSPSRLASTSHQSTQAIRQLCMVLTVCDGHFPPPYDVLTWAWQHRMKRRPAFLLKPVVTPLYSAARSYSRSKPPRAPMCLLAMIMTSLQMIHGWLETALVRISSHI